jgi:hypothetical protein
MAGNADTDRRMIVAIITLLPTRGFNVLPLAARTVV